MQAGLNQPNPALQLCFATVFEVKLIAVNPTYVRLMDRLYLMSIWIAGTAIFFMSLIIPWGVFTRYVLGTGSHWPEPIAILLMMLFTFIGAAASYRAGAHIAVSMVVDTLPAAIQSLGRGVVHVLMLVICCFVLFYGSRLCIETMGQSIAELPWLPVGVTYAAIPIGSLLTLLFVLEQMMYGSQANNPMVMVQDQDVPAIQESR